MYTLKEFAKYNKVKSLVINKRQATVMGDGIRKTEYYKDAYNKSKVIVKSFGNLDMDNIKADTKDDGYELSINYWELTEDEQKYIDNAKNKMVHPNINIVKDKLICLIAIIVEVLAIIFQFKYFGYKLGMGLFIVEYPLLLAQTWFIGIARR